MPERTEVARPWRNVAEAQKAFGWGVDEDGVFRDNSKSWRAGVTNVANRRNRAIGTKELLDAVLVFSPRGGISAADLASATGLSRNRASEMLAGLPARMVHRWRDAAGRIRYLPAWSYLESDITSASRRVRVIFQEARAPRRMVDQIRDVCEQAREFIRGGDWGAVSDLLQRNELNPAWVRRALSPRERLAVSRIVLELRAGIAMQRGAPDYAINVARRGLLIAGDDAGRLRLLSVLGAAMRMMPEGGPKASISVYREALDLANRLPPTSRKEMLRHLNSAIVAPLLALGSTEDALEHARTAVGQVDEAGTGEGEARLRLATCLALIGNEDKAAELLESPLTESVDHWLLGWRARIGASYLTKGASDGEKNRRFVVAWKANEGYLFQRLLLMDAMSRESAEYRAEEWGSPFREELIHQSALIHARYLKIRPSQCPQCRKKGPWHALRHAMESQPYRSTTFMKS